MGMIIGLAAFLVVVWILGSAWFKGALGELWVHGFLRAQLRGDDYRILHDLTLPIHGGTTQIDHVVVSPSGVFVVETKNMKGWIFGSADQAEWTQIVFRRKSRFQNPMRQNFKHLKAVEAILHIPPHKIHGVVAFVGSASAKTAMPLGVVWGVGALVDYIKSRRAVVLSEDEIQGIADRLSSDEFRSTFTRRHAHVRRVKTQAKERRKSANCPRCGAVMVERTNRQSGDAFLACTRYPTCKGTRRLS
jgi:restriction system protein